jgi:hypothetical protein
MAEAYPTPLAGQRITATLLRLMQPQVARKTADTSRAATTTTTADPHLQFELAANAVYTLDGWIKYDGPTAGDLTVDFTAPSGCLGEYTSWGAGNSVIGSTSAPALQSDTQDVRGYLIRTETNDIAASRGFGCLGTGGSQLTLLLNGTIRNAATPGTYSLDWAQTVSNATATTLYTDSWLRLQRIA